MEFDGEGIEEGTVRCLEFSVVLGMVFKRIKTVKMDYYQIKSRARIRSMYRWLSPLRNQWWKHGSRSSSCDKLVSEGDVPTICKDRGEREERSVSESPREGRRAGYWEKTKLQGREAPEE